ncbi:hypothetical protein CAEBREN_13740 [Caenorhabditis brenneri]|uniref:Uncharacterized protein n=1 Tax=Caenorhabditis brenneri TaxID=135651 RepID=G0MMQ3_CAEBE|nr:hypothetical protein CAEBREN_13740 [Caenorhabditis brenneri]
MTRVEKSALAPTAPPSEETFDKSLVNLIGRLNALKFDVADPAFKAEIAAIKSLREFLNESYPAKLKAVKTKEMKGAEVVLALKLTVNEVQGNLDCASLKVKELEERICSQEIANVAKKVMNTMIMKIESKEQGDRHNIQLASIARRNEEDLQKAINKLEEENKAKTDEMEQLHRDQLKALQEKLAAKAEEAENLRKADNEKQRTMDFWKQEIPKIVGNYSEAAGKRQRMDDDEA